MKRIGLFLIALAVFAGVNASNQTINIDSIRQEVVQNSKEIQAQKKDSIMFSRLSAEQILELKKGEQEVKMREIDANSREDMPFSGYQLFLIILLPFLFVAVIVYITSKAKKEEAKRRYDLYTKSLEMGQAIPEHFFDAPKANPSSNLKRGILWLVVGLALLIYFIIVDKSNALIVGIVPTFVGIGYLLVHILDKPKKELTEKKDEQHG